MVTESDSICTNNNTKIKQITKISVRLSKVQENGILKLKLFKKRNNRKLHFGARLIFEDLRRQLEARTSLGEALKVRLTEMENKDARKEAQLVELQRLLQETKDQHESELEAVESKYKAQVEINLLLESRILELHGTLEPATCSTTTMNNLASSASPKERSPPLSASLASSSEGSLAFIHSGTGIIMNDCCDTAGEIPNLQAIVEPVPNQATSPSRQS